MENTEKKYYERSYKLVLENTKYNSEGKAVITLDDEWREEKEWDAMFNQTEVLYDRVPVSKIEPMNDKQYYVRGCTALLDALGGAIHHIGNVHKYAREEDRPEKTLFIITTDGMENSSRQYSYEKVKEMVERQKEKYGWEFLFLGANIDAIDVAGKFGIDSNRALNYVSDHKGTQLNYEVLNKTVSEFRASKSLVKEEIDAMFAACSAPIKDDYKKRHRN